MVMRDFQERKFANRILYSWPVLLLASALVALSLLGVARNLQRYISLKHEVAFTEKALAEYEASKKSFEEQLHALDTPGGLEKEARARFNLKKPGEEVVLFLDNDLPQNPQGLRTQVVSIWESVKNYIYDLF